MKKLIQLNLFPNHFLPEPHRNREGKLVSETELTGSPTPTLTELALRILLSRVDPQISKTILEEFYVLPLERPGAFQHIFNLCVPGSVSLEESPRKEHWLSENDGPLTGTGVCPNPQHRERQIFIKPMEERYTWESSTISIQSLGGTAAVQWRCCLHGCLDFLGPGPQEQTPEGNAGASANDSMDIDLEESEVVQTVRFEMDVELGFDD